MVMTSAAALQLHYDEIQANMPVLPLAAAPKGYSDLDFSSIDPSTYTKITHVLQKAAAGIEQCQVCSRSSTADGLGFKISTRLDFANRTIQATAGQFLCSLCRAVSSTSLLLELATPTLGSEDYARSEALQQLFLHFAAVNSAPASITGNPEALAVWVQELACRAYSLQVVASSIRGWRLLGPTGAAVQQGVPGAGLQLLQQLLGPAQTDVAKPSATAAAATNGHSKFGKKLASTQATAANHQQKQQKRSKGDSFRIAADEKKQHKQPAAGAPANKKQKTIVQQADPSLSSGKRKASPGNAEPHDKKPKKHSSAAAFVSTEALTPATPLAATADKQRLESAREGSVPKKKAPKVSRQGDRGVASVGAAAQAAGTTAGTAAVPLKTPQPSKSKKAGKHRLSGPV